MAQSCLGKPPSGLWWYKVDCILALTLFSRHQIIFVPAMNAEMWNNAINRKNVSYLKKIGIEFIGPEYGPLSCGEIGIGRLSDPKKIIKIFIEF